MISASSLKASLLPFPCLGLQDGGHAGRGNGGRGLVLLSFLGPEYLASSWPCAPVLSAVCFIPVWATRSTLVMRNRVSDGCMATSRQTATVGLPFLETRYGSPSLLRRVDATEFSKLYLTDYISQAMGKLGTSLSSGYVMVNGTQTQVLLVGAPTHGRSRTMKFCFLLVIQLHDYTVLGKVEIWSQTDLRQT